MKRFYVYDPSTGKIKRRGVCQDIDFELQAQEGEAVREGDITNETHVIDGVPVHVPPPEPTEEEKAAQAAAEEEAALARLVAGTLPDIVLDFENRLRVLEKKDPLSKTDFAAAMEAKR